MAKFIQAFFGNGEEWAQKNSEPSWFGFLITLKDDHMITKTEIMKKLDEKKIQSRLLFAGNLIQQPYFDEKRRSNEGYRIIGKETNTDKAMNDSFWIGIYPNMTEEMLNYIIRNISSLLLNNNL